VPPSGGPTVAPGAASAYYLIKDTVGAKQLP
jgi:hypothetical protein